MANRVGADPENPAHHLVIPSADARRLPLLGMGFRRGRVQGLGF